MLGRLSPVAAPAPSRTAAVCAAALEAARDACFEHGQTLALLPVQRAHSLLSRVQDAYEAAHAWQIALGAYLLYFFIRNYSRWLAWIWVTVLLLMAQSLFVLWTMLMIGSDIAMVSAVNISARGFYIWTSTVRWYRGGSIRRRVQLRRLLRSAETWGEWSAIASELDNLDGKSEWRDAPSGIFNQQGVLHSTQQLRDAREAGDTDELVRLLQTLMVRNHHNVDMRALHRECRVGTKRVIEDYVAEVVTSMQWLQNLDTARLSAADKYRIFERYSMCLGHTALCLSGGGSLSMYHLGVVKAMIESDCLPRIVSGTSGGAIVAAHLALHTNAELLEHIIVPDISTRYPERWFPPVEQQLYSFLKKGCLVDNDEFAACTKRHYGDVTFEEAFQRTGRIVNINISASSRGKSNAARSALLLNALTTPHVLIRSAVHASCCLPTIMRPTALLAKDSAGNVVPFASSSNPGAGLWMDGSFTADIPRDRLLELFHVTQTIVSQVNPHIVAMLNANHRGGDFNIFRRLESALSSDVIYRLQMLAKLGLLPAMYGPDIKAIAFKQKYTGDATILPKLGGPSCMLRLVTNPTENMMRNYIAEGTAAAFRTMSFMKHLLTIEQTLNRCLESAMRAAAVPAAAPAATPSAAPAPAAMAAIPHNNSFTRLPLAHMQRSATRLAETDASSNVAKEADADVNSCRRRVGGGSCSGSIASAAAMPAATMAAAAKPRDLSAGCGSSGAWAMRPREQSASDCIIRRSREEQRIKIGRSSLAAGRSNEVFAECAHTEGEQSPAQGSYAELALEEVAQLNCQLREMEARAVGAERRAERLALALRTLHAQTEEVLQADEEQDF